MSRCEYYGVGFASGGSSDFTDFTFGTRLSDAFLNQNTSLFSAMNTSTGELLPSNEVVMFIDNHDTQRVSALLYTNSTHERSVVLMLAQGNGCINVMSGYGFDRSAVQTRDAGPASDGNGWPSAPSTPMNAVGAPPPSAHRRRGAASASTGIPPSRRWWRFE